MNIKKDDTLPNLFIELKDLIGLQKTIELCKQYGGDTVYIPKLDSYNRIVRNNNIIIDYNSGMSYSQLSKKYSLSTVSIRSIISSYFCL